MIVRRFLLDRREEVIVKLVRELLELFKIRVLENEEGTGGERADFAVLSVRHEIIMEPVPTVHTELFAEEETGEERRFSLSGAARQDEKAMAAVHRLVKLNLYRLFRVHFAMPAAAWGILHGVRPTKIVHRFIEAGFTQEEIVARLLEDYEVSLEKASYMTAMAFRQRPFLQTSDERTISVYIGIPFCRSRCLYCSFPAYILPNDEQLAAFFAAWDKDLAAAKREIERHRLKVQSIYIGGGTPTSLSNADFERMLSLVEDAFYGEHTGEFTVEAGRPDTMTPDKALAMKRHRVSRVSVNPQTMQQRTLRRIGRAHTPEDIVRMFCLLRETGEFSINMDVILGLPGETRADVADTMTKVLALRPDDVTLHSLALKRGSKLKMHLEEYELPDDAEVQAMFQTAMERVAGAGFLPYYLYRQGYMSGQLENVGCACPGAESMYNIQIMDENQTILGIGCAATSKIMNFRTKRLKASFNAKDFHTYVRDIDAYIAKRAALLQEAYGDGEDEATC